MDQVSQQEQASPHRQARPAKPGGKARRVGPTQLAAVVLIFLVALAHLMAPDQLERMERLLLDWRFLIRGPEAPSGDVVIVAYDEVSIRHFGRWPPSRTLLAEAIDRVSAEGAAAIALDYLFLEPQQSASHEIRDFLGRVITGLPGDDPLRAEARRIAEDDAADRRLADSIARAGNVVLAFAYSPDAGIAEIPDEVVDWAIVRNSGACAQPNVVEIAARLQAPIPSLAGSAALGGNVNVNFDVDGAPRFEFMTSAIDGYCFAPLSLAGTAVMREIPWTEVGVAFGQHVSLAGSEVAIDLENQVMVNYFGPGGTIRTFSFGDVISGRLPLNVFDGKLVFFGTNFLGGTDQFRSPFDLTLSGVERHATIAERLLHGGSIVRPAGSLYLSLAAILVLGGLAAFLARKLAAGPGVAANAGLALGWFVASYVALFPFGIWVNALYPIAAILLGTALQIAVRAVEEERQRRAAQADLLRSEERYALAARGANDGLWDWDMLAGTFYTSPRWQQMLGLRAERMSNLPGDWFDRVHRDDIDILRAAIDAHLSGSSAHLEQELRMRHADGEDRWVTVRGMAVRDADGRAARFAGSMTDITARKLAERQLMFNALHSHLTGLPNRALLIDRTDQALQLWSRDRNADVILAVLDLDRFGHFNESLGQRVGDDILIMLARNLEAVMRPDDTLAHLGEDEFAITRFAAGNVEAQVEELIATLKSVLGQRLEIGDRLLEIEASIGVVIASQAAGAAADELLRDANLALYRAKAQGRNQVVRFEPSMHQSAMKRFGLEADLKRAIAAGDQLELFYQPIIELKDGRLHGFEALIRWRHPERGMISPVDFIPLAEDTDMIVEIGRRSIMEAARQIAAWMPAEGDPPQIAVNVSGKQFMAAGLLEDIERTLQKTGIPKGSLKLEVTESLIMDNPERTAEILRKVITMGCKVSIDDFGTGYSSLSHLHRFPFNTLKIDRSFVMRIAESREGLEIVRVISSLAHILERDVVAEGVETEEQAALLAKLGIQYGQGYFWSKPLPATEASVFLAKNRQKFQKS